MFLNSKSNLRTLGSVPEEEERRNTVSTAGGGSVVSASGPWESRSIAPPSAVATITKLQVDAESFANLGEVEIELMRGVPLGSVLRNFGEILQDAAGSSSTYELSRHTMQLEAFLSHNWCTNRWEKAFCLMLHFNLEWAVLGTAICVAVMYCLGVLGGFPTQTVEWKDWPTGILFKVLMPPIFLAMLANARTFTVRLPGFRKYVFLDKTCINQVDRELQLRGINKLAAFVRHSRAMVVVYTDDYLKRLWTVFELSSFLALHPIRNLYILPTTEGHTFVYGFFAAYLSNLVASLLDPAIFSDRMFRYMGGSKLIVAVMFGYIFFRRVRHDSRRFETIKASASTFAIQNCVCANEDDRPLVYGNITALMKGCGAVDEEATESDTLETFNDLVQKTLPAVFARAMGHVHMRYRLLVILSCSFSIPLLLDDSVQVIYGMPPLVLLVYASGEVAKCMLIYPSVLWGLCYCAGRNLALSPNSTKDRLFRAVVVAFSLFVAFGISWVVEKLQPWAMGSIGRFIGYLGGCVFCVLISFRIILAQDLNLHDSFSEAKMNDGRSRSIEDILDTSSHPAAVAYGQERCRRKESGVDSRPSSCGASETIAGPSKSESVAEAMPSEKAARYEIFCEDLASRAESVDDIVTV